MEALSAYRSFPRAEGKQCPVTKDRDRRVQLCRLGFIARAIPCERESPRIHVVACGPSRSRSSFRPSFSWSWRSRRIRASRSSSFRQEGSQRLRSNVATMTLCVSRASLQSTRSNGCGHRAGRTDRDRCGVRELIRDERNERRNVAFEVERRIVMPGFLPGLGRASCHVSDQGSWSSKQT